jgi:hypothetical protein
MLARENADCHAVWFRQNMTRHNWNLFPVTGSKIASTIVVWQIGHNQKRVFLNIVPVPVVLAEEKL